MLPRPLPVAADPLIAPSQSLQSWRRRSASILALAPDARQVPEDELGLEVLGEEIRRVVVRAHRPQLQLLLKDVLLYPQVLDVDVSGFAQALAVRYADCGGGICAHRASDRIAIVHQHQHYSQSLRGSFDHRVQLCLAAAQRNDLLS